MTRPRVCLWILPLLAAVPAVAQGPQAQGKGRLTGHIVSSLAGSPIPGAAVELDSTSWKTATDSAGAFHFDSVTPGVYLLQVRAIGYEPGTWRVRLRPDQPLDHAFQLDPAALSLPAVGGEGGAPPRAARPPRPQPAAGPPLPARPRRLFPSRGGGGGGAPPGGAPLPRFRAPPKTGEA